MSKRLYILFTLLLALMIAACGGQAEPDPTATTASDSAAPTDEPAAVPTVSADVEGSIWVLLPDSASSARWETDDRRFFEQSFDAAGVEYNIVNAEGDARTQQTQAEQAITSGAKVILMVNLDSGSGAAIIAAAREADVAVIDYDRLTVEGPGADVYVSFDNVQVGRTMGNVLEPLINAQDGTPQVVTLNGGPTDNNATLFREGYYEIAQPHFDDGSWALVDDQFVPEWDNQQALVIFEQILTAADGNVSAVFAANDGLAGAVISAFENAGIDPATAGIPISGQDATTGGIQNIIAGDQAMTVYKSIKAEAEAAATVAIRLLQGESIDDLTGGTTINNGTNDLPFVALEPIGVTKDNVMDTVIADGFRTLEEVCVGDFAAFCDELQNGTDSGLAGAGEGVEGSIWVLLPDSASSARWETDDRRFFEAAFEEAGVEYNIVNAEGDARTQQTQAEQAITSGAAVIMMVNLDSGSGAAIIATAREAGVAVVDYDRLTIEGPGADIYVSFDNEEVGRTMGTVLEPMINAQDGTPQVVLLNGGPTDNNATLFRNGYFGVAEPYFNDGSWELVADQAVPEWDNQQALVVFEQILTAADGNVSAVFAANDGLAGATISALKNAGMSPSDAGIPISGQDATVGGIQNILAGDQAMTVYKPIKAEAEAAARAAIALLKGEDLTALTGGLTLNNGTSDVPFLALEPVGVTIDKIASTVIADGFRTWEEVCVGDFAQFCTDEVMSGEMTMDDGGSEMMDFMAMMPDASGADGSVWVLLPDSASSARWETDDRRFFEQAFEAAGVDYNIVNAEGDARTQQTQAEQAITSGAKVILMVNLDSGSGAAIIALAREAGVAVIDYDRLTVEGSGADVYVSFDNEEVGRTMGTVLEPLIAAQDAPKLVMLNGGPTDNNATLFRNGYFEIAEPYINDGTWELVADQAVPEWDNQQALVIFEQILTANDEVTAVFAANDGLAGAVISALKNAGMDPSDLGIPISGQDATVGGIQNVLAGDQAMTVYKPIKAEAEAAAVAAVMLLLGQDLADLTDGLTIDNGTSQVPFIALTPVGVTVDNVAETVIADGFRTWEEVCVGEFEAFCPADR